MTATATAARPGPRFLVLAAALIALGPMSFDFYLPSFPAISDDLGVPVSSVQLTLSAALLGMGLGQLVYGPLMDRFGRRPPMVAGLAVYIAASLGCALSQSLGVLIALRVVQALGGCAGVVASRAMTRDLYSGRDLAKAMSLIFLIFGIAPVLSPILGTLVLGWTSWRGLFVVLMAYGLICLVAVLRFPETHAPDSRTDHGVSRAVRAYGMLLRNHVVMISVLLQALTGAALFSFISLSPAVFLEYGGLQNSAFLLIFGGVSLALFVMSQVNVRLLDRLEPRQIMAGAVIVQFIAAVGLVASALLVLPIWTFVLFLTVAVAGVGLLMPNSTATALEPYPRSAGSASALSGALGMLGGALWAAVLASLSVTPPVAMAVGIAVATGLSVLLTQWLLRHRAAAADGA